MRKTLLTKLALLLVMLVGAGSAWAADQTYTIGWGTATGDEGTYTNFTATSGSVSGILSFSTAKNDGTTAPAYNSNNKELRLYYASSGNGGSITLTPETGVTITGFVITTSTSPSVNYTVDGGSATSVSASNNTYTVSDISASSSLMIQNVNTSNTQLRIKTIQITYTISGVPTCPTPSFSPVAGAVASGTKVSISSIDGATIYYTTDGNNPSASSNVYSNPIEITSATTIKAYATKSGYNDSEVATAAYTIKQSISGYTIDFENDLEDYVDWTFDNIGTSNNAITAHGGNKYGANINSSGGGVATASIQTTDKIALPETFTCYISKASNNATSSNWTLDVSTDGTNWTKVGEKSAASMDKGVWEEFTADLSEYSDVYVRLSYANSTAVRAIDDISITMRAPSTSPVINASGIQIAYDATSGQINYTITNPTDGETLGATTNADWISNISVDADKVTFTTTENSGSEDRTANITLTYAGATNKVVTVTQKHFVVDYATLPFTFEGGKSTIDSTDGLSHEGLGSDYNSSPRLRFDDTGDYLILKINENPGILTFDIKGNSFSGGTFTVQTSEDGVNYIDLKAFTAPAADTQTYKYPLPLTARYIKWIYTEKVSGNVALGNISLSKPVSVTSNGWATFVTPCDVQFEAGNAFIVTNASVAGGLTLSEVTKVPADSPILLKGEGEKAMTALSVAPIALDDMSDNKLSVCDGDIESGKYAYVLAKEGAGAAFKQWTGNKSVLNGRVVLLLDEAVAARSIFMLDDETTGIASVKVSKSTEQVYDLQGRRVAQPTKGLYIVNGKKMILK
ncbi:MAG: chitobiase/beta-hexosaminidase C-terminal domain-containing protein [Prevotella sp.]|nr:chitobiase/beta-hexosaminidase C-terminal domain-containing protein [Prevotella sp.]